MWCAFSAWDIFFVVVPGLRSSDSPAAAGPGCHILGFQLRPICDGWEEVDFKWQDGGIDFRGQVLKLICQVGTGF